MKHVLDLANEAFEAARRRDLDAELEALAPLIHAGHSAVNVALHAWCDRALIVMHAVMRQSNTQLGTQLELEDYDSGETFPIDRVPPESVWAGRMFMAHAHRDRGQWYALWSAVPADPEAITDHVMALLHSMAATAEIYAQENQPELSCCPEHANPMLAADRAAMAHYN